MNKQDDLVDDDILMTHGVAMLNQDHKSWIDRLCGGVHLFVHFSQVGMYHDPHVEDGATAGDSRMIFTESMPRRVGSFYRGEGLETVCID